MDSSSTAKPTDGIGLSVEMPPPAPPVSSQYSGPSAETLTPVHLNTSLVHIDALKYSTSPKEFIDGLE
jgi:hypothetical protein